MPPLDLIGQHFNRLTVIRREPNDKHSKAMWLCKCDCGNTTVLASQTLKSGNTKSCGCFRRDFGARKTIDLKGKVFDRLTVIKIKSKDRHGNITWVCQCSCGNIVVANSNLLRNGHKKSCGCLHRELAAKTAIDITDQKFGRLTVVSRAGSKGKNALWLCRCDCGNMVTALGIALRHGHTKSCGCLKVERFDIMITTHGMTGTHQYNSWRAMKRRCLSPKDDKYQDYGGRGIKIHERWLESFENFWEDMGPTYQDGLTLERKDNNGNYELSNCHWASRKEQSRNRRANHVVDSPLGRMCISELAEKSGVNYDVLKGRIKRGWSSDKLLIPSRPINRKKLLTSR